VVLALTGTANAESAASPTEEARAAESQTDREDDRSAKDEESRAPSRLHAGGSHPCMRCRTAPPAAPRSRGTRQIFRPPIA